MHHTVRNKLSVMMFLELFIWAAWLPLLPGYLKSLDFTSWQQAWILNAFALASFTAMFFSTQFADRNFAAEKFMAFSHLVGGLAMLSLYWVTDFWPFFLLMLTFSLFYVPTLSISNSIAFASLKDAQQDFGKIRVWGTIGWIAASWPLIFLNETKFIFLISGIASLLLAAFSLTLPHTPPRPAQVGGTKFAWLEAMKLLRNPFIFILFVVTFLVAVVFNAYFVLTGDFLKSIDIPKNWIMPVMSIGQVAEIFGMAVLGLVLKRFGWRTTMTVGALGYVILFGVFALAPFPALAIPGNLLHGVCYAFFVTTLYIFVDDFFPKDARSSAQGLFNFLLLGLGGFVGNFLWVHLRDAFMIEEKVNYQILFLIPAATAFFAAFLLVAFFRPPVKASQPEPAPEMVSK